jgi:hypothetical protein
MKLSFAASNAYIDEFLLNASYRKTVLTRSAIISVSCRHNLNTEKRYRHEWRPKGFNREVFINRFCPKKAISLLSCILFGISLIYKVLF